MIITRSEPVQLEHYEFARDLIDKVPDEEPMGPEVRKKIIMALKAEFPGLLILEAMKTYLDALNGQHPNRPWKKPRKTT
jgi:hypothetical protein